MSWLDFIAHKYPGWTLFFLGIALWILVNSMRHWFQINHNHYHYNEADETKGEVIE